MGRGGYRSGAGRPGWRVKVDACERADALGIVASRNQIAELVHVPCHFGGERSSFLCPSCGRRCRFLYRPPGQWHFECRECLDLAYPVENESRVHRLRRRQRKLEARLGPHHSKPERMHWRRFWRLREAIEAIDRKLDRILSGQLARIRARRGHRDDAHEPQGRRK
jgi:hypothetical protein